jgi:prepilin-type processing-associated H-X9-DG protein
MSQAVLRSAAADSPFDPESIPETVVLVRDRSRLRISWRSGETAELGAPRLRAACRCAGCTRARADAAPAQSFDGATIARVLPIGDYAINIAFADGHERGIFPWPFLRALAGDGDTAVAGRRDGPSP